MRFDFPRRNALLATALGTTLVLGCDGGTRGRDASVPSSQRVAEVSVRIDAPTGSAPAVSVLAFRASVTGLAPTDVLGVVDPLIAGAPETRCELRDVAAGARSLRAQGGTIELEELANVSLELAPAKQTLHPAPRVYPQLAATVGGVIGEAGPFDLMGVPETIAVGLLGEGESRVQLDVPALPRLLGASGEAIANGTRLDLTSDLSLTVAGPARSFVEIRPFGASLAIACPVGSNGHVVVPHDLLEKVMADSGHAPVSLEAVWRDSRLVQAQAGGQTTRLSLEARSSVVLDVRAAAPAAEATKSLSPNAP